jgi:hypothetical protein
MSVSRKGLPVNTLPYQEAFHRIRREYLEMPGMRLTPRQLQCLSGVDGAICRLVLDDLVRAKFLQLEPEGAYVKCADGSVPRLRTAKAAWKPRVVPAASHRVG